MLPKISRVSDELHRASVLYLFLAITAVVLPFWVVSVPPATDLPQHLSQIFLLNEALGGYRPELTVTPWYYPNTLIYVLIYCLWQLADPLTVGRLTMSLLAAAWVLGGFALAKFCQRPVGNWLIGVPLAFNFLFYWGLLNFLIGWPVFCLFLVLATARPCLRQTLAMAGAGLLLYYAHALWFLMANVWLIARFIDRQPGSWRLSLVAMLPAWVFSIFWYPQLATARRVSGVPTGVGWGKMPLERADLDYFTNAAQGGLQGELEYMFMLVLAAWVALAISTRWRNLDSETNKPLLVAALGLILAYWVLPWSYMNTIFFSQRWLPCGMTLLLLALPAPNIPRVYGITVGITLTLIFSMATIKAWRDWEGEQMGGFIEAIGKLEKDDRVFGVDMFGGSLYVKGRPGLQLSSYAQALRGCDTNFSFTEHYSGIVQYLDQQRLNPTRQLIWLPYQTKQQHLLGFNKVLINGDSDVHAFSREKLQIDPVDNSSATWRLYRIRQQKE